MTACRFCEIVSEGSYAEVDELTSCVLFEPFNPVTPGHMLAVPARHVATADADPLALGEAMATAARYARRHAIGDFNVIQSNGAAATQGVSHLHVHVVPRRAGDGEGLPWPWTHRAPRLNPVLATRAAEGT